MKDNESMSLVNRTKNPISRLLRHAWVRAVELFYPPPLRRPPHPQGKSTVEGLLEMYVKTCKSRFIDSFSFLSMSLSRFSATFNVPDVVKGTFPHLFNVVTWLLVGN